MSHATPLHKIDALNLDFPGVQMYIKDESEHPYKTIKDRRNEGIIAEAARLGVDKLVLITSGNNGYSLSKLAENTDIQVTCIVSKSISENIYKKLVAVAHDVIKVNLKEKILRPEEIIAFAREKDDEVIWDVTNGYEEAYGGIVNEIYSQLEKVDYIVVPLGSGGIFVGISEQLSTAFHDARVIGIGPKATYDSFADKLSTPWSPYTKAIQNYEKVGHKIIRISESEIRKCHTDYKNICNCEPSASVVFGALNHVEVKKGDVVVFINSGNSL
jgi:cysteine synthase